MNAQPVGVAATGGPCDASRVFGPGGVILRGAWTADALRPLQPIWFGLAIAQPGPLDCSTVPVVAVAGRNRLSDRLTACGFPVTGDSFAFHLTVASTDPAEALSRTRCVAASRLRPVGSDVSVWPALAPARALPQIRLLQSGGSCELPDFLSVGRFGLRRGGCYQEDPNLASRHSHKCGLRKPSDQARSRFQEPGAATPCARY
jgi:hypothetical protein